MEQFKHYSFDLWLTLIKSNPHFKELRDRMLYDLFSYNNSFEEAREIIKKIDVSSNIYSEISGIHVTSFRMLYDVIIALGTKPDAISYLLLEGIHKAIQSLFITNPPFLFDEDTKSTLEELKRRGSTLSIGSNTGFISGETIRVVLKQLEIIKLFNFEVFSDQIGYSKPNYSFFLEVYSRAYRCNSELKVRDFSSILHVGDNPIADIKGAEEFGIRAFQINSNNKKIIDLL